MFCKRRGEEEEEEEGEEGKEEEEQKEEEGGGGAEGGGIGGGGGGGGEGVEYIRDNTIEDGKCLHNSSNYCARDSYCAFLGLNVSNSAHNCGCVVDGAVMLWQQFEYYYNYYY